MKILRTNDLKKTQRTFEKTLTLFTFKARYPAKHTKELKKYNPKVIKTLKRKKHTKDGNNAQTKSITTSYFNFNKTLKLKHSASDKYLEHATALINSQTLWLFFNCLKLETRKQQVSFGINRGILFKITQRSYR